MLFNLPIGILVLAVGAFGIGLAEFLIMGLLPEVADGMGVTISQAGYFISAYALGVVVGAPLLSIVGREMPPKQKLIVLMVIFTIANAISAIAPNAPVLLLCRFLSGLPHGAFLGFAAVVATRMAGPGKAASAISLMIAGLTLSNVIGVPLATFVGQATSWRMAFGLISLVGLVTLVCLALGLPKSAPDPKQSLKEEFRIFKNPRLWYLIAFASIGFGGFFAWFSYITPILTKVTAIPQAHVPYLLALAGLGMTFGNLLGGRFTDKFSPISVAVTMAISMMLILVMNALLAPYPWAIYGLTFLTGANAMALGVPIQVLLIDASKESPFLGSSLGHGAFNMGNSIGAFMGGLPLAAGYGLTSPWWTGALLTFAGILIVWRLISITRASESPMPIPATSLLK